MHRKKILLTLVFVFIIIVTEISYFLLFNRNNTPISEQEQEKIEFSNFLKQRNEFLQTLSVSSKKEIVKLGDEKQTISLKNGQLTITNNSKRVWKSPSYWWIDNFIIADSNNDGIIDINISLWKSGNFGTSKPFWIKKNDMSVKNHFFIYDYTDKKMKLIWGSSNLKAPNCAIKIADINNDYLNELIVIEGDYFQKPICKDNYIAVWKWNGWGFSNDWRSKKGNFSNLNLENWKLSK